MFAECFAWLGCYVFKYRKEVVFNNLSNSFPHKSRKETRQITRNFYRHFFQIIFEVLKSKGFQKSDWHKHVRVKNPEVMQTFLDQGKSVILMTGHIANWEWSAGGINAAFDQDLAVLYKKIKGTAFAKVMGSIRQQGGVKLVEKDSALRYMVKTKDEQQIIGIISDQIPSIGAEKYWMHFLAQETAFYRGAEKFSRMLKTPVVYVDMRKIKPGVYELVLKEIYNGVDEIEEGRITKKYSEFLEETIQAKPSDYLWSHRRWKYTKEEASKATGKPFVFID